MKSKMAVNFETYYFFQLLEHVRKGGFETYDEENKAYLDKLLTYLENENDALESIEKLASMQSTSDLAIFFSDILDHLQYVTPEDSLEKIKEYTQDFLEIFEVFMQQEEFKTGLDAQLFATADAEEEAEAEVSFREFCQHLIAEYIEKGKKELPADLREPFAGYLSQLLAHPDLARRFEDHLPDVRAGRFSELTAEITQIPDNGNVDGFVRNFSSNLSQWIMLFSGMLVEYPEDVADLCQPLPAEAEFEVAEPEAEAESFETADVIDAADAADDGDEEPFEKRFEDAEAALEESLEAEEAPADENADELEAFAENFSELEQKRTRPVEVSEAELQRRQELREYVVNEVKSYTDEILELLDLQVESPDETQAEALQESLKGLKDLGQIHSYPGVEQTAERLIHIFQQAGGKTPLVSGEERPLLAGLFNILPEYIDAVVNEQEDSYMESILEKLTLLKSRLLKREAPVGASAVETVQIAFQEVAGKYAAQLQHYVLTPDAEAPEAVLENLLFWSETLVPDAVETVEALQRLLAADLTAQMEDADREMVAELLRTWETAFTSTSGETWEAQCMQLEALQQQLEASDTRAQQAEAVAAFQDVTLRQVGELASTLTHEGIDLGLFIKKDLGEFFVRCQDNSGLLNNAELESMFVDLADQLEDFDPEQILDPEEFQDGLRGFLEQLQDGIAALPEDIPVDALITQFDEILNLVVDESELDAAAAPVGEAEEALMADFLEAEAAAEEEAAASEDEMTPEEAEEGDMEIAEVFRLEAAGYVDEMRGLITSLEARLDDKDTWHQMGVTVHTLKGSARMVGRDDVAELAGPLDELVEQIEAEALPAELDLMPVLSTLVDVIGERIAGAEVPADDILEQLQSYVDKFAAEAAPAEGEAAAETFQEVPAIQDFIHLKEQDADLLEIFQNEVGNNFDIVEKNLTNLEKFTYDKEALQQVERSVHEIRSAAKMLGVLEIAEIAEKLEKIFELLILKQIEDFRSVIPHTRRGMYVIRELTTSHVIRKSVYEEVMANLDRILSGESVVETPLEPAAPAARETESAAFAPESADVESPFRDEEVEAETPEEAAELAEAPEAETVAADAVPESPELEVAPQVLELYLQEAGEQLDDINYLLLKLEKQPENEELQHHLMRCMHTLKGSSSMVYARQIESLSHRCEDILEKNINEKRLMDSNLFDLLFEVMDEVQFILDGIRAHKKETVRHHGLILKKLDTYMNAPAMPAAAEETQPEPEAEPAPPAPEAAVVMVEAETPEEVNRKETYLRLNINKMNHLLNLAAELVISNNQFKSQLDRLKNLMPMLNTNLKVFRDTEDYLNTMVREGKRIQEIIDPLVEDKPGTKESMKKQIDNVQRVLKNVKAIQDELTSLSHTMKENSKTYDENLQKLNKLSNELLDEIMQARLVPINMLFQRFHRPIRDLARQLQKQIRLSIRGEETELDRTLIDELHEPLLHIIRNAIDHGLETVDARKKEGKNPEGTLEIKASRDRNQVIIEIKDDGRGIDLEGVKAAAIEKGLLSEADGEEMSDQELFEYLFYPGFSTAKETTLVSGRGVGLDAVKTQIEKAKGDIRMYTEKGKGTTFSIRVPISLSVIQSMLVDVSGHVYSVPLLQVEETLHVSGQDLLSDDGKFYIRYREKKIPVLQLQHLLKMRNNQDKTISPAASYPVIMVQDEGNRVALLVDKIIRREEILIKSLGPGLRRLKYISGGSIMADGQVVLVLDVPQIIQDMLKGVTYVRSEEEPEAVKEALPVKEEAAVSTGSIRSARKRKRIEGRKPVALVVDDSLSIRKYLSSLLMQRGYVTDTARNGYEALELLNKQDFDIMVTDLEMPKLSGYELIETLRYDQRFTGFPIIVLTGRAGDNFRQLTTELGADAYIIKPFKEKELFEQIDKFIEYKS